MTFLGFDALTDFLVMRFRVHHRKTKTNDCVNLATPFVIAHERTIFLFFINRSAASEAEALLPHGGDKRGLGRLSVLVTTLLVLQCFVFYSAGRVACTLRRPPDRSFRDGVSGLLAAAARGE